jgi:hypothetical protein
MKLSISRLGRHLVVVANCYNASTLAATDPSAATVTFLRNVQGAFVASALGVVTLTKIADKVGVHGALIDTGTNDVSNLVAIVEATIGGVATKEIVILGRSVATGAPSILVEASDKAGRVDFGISE